MIPVQTATVDEPEGSLERDLLARHGSDDTTPAGAAPRVRNPLADTDDFGQPTPEPNPMVEPTWIQICAMGFEIPGIGWGHLPLAGDIGGDIIAAILDKFDTRIAKRCEPDHVIPHSRGGPTAIWNLASLCKHHHRLKHQAGWKLTMTPDGQCTWTDPHGTPIRNPPHQPPRTRRLTQRQCCPA